MAGQKQQRSRAKQVQKQSTKSSETENRTRLIDAISTAAPSALLFIGLIMLAVANPYGEYLIGIGVVLQLVFLVFRVPKLFSQDESIQSKSNLKKS